MRDKDSGFRVQGLELQIKGTPYTPYTPYSDVLTIT
jgi:hypothetical protein